MERIGVFCSSHKNLAKAYTDAAAQLGTWIGKEKKTLVYGGTRLGLMEIMAQAVKREKGQVYGVVPTLVTARGLVSDCVDVEFRCENLSDRKEIMLRESEVLVALPGGIGTLDEVFTTVAAHTMGYHHRLTVLYNVAGFWDTTLAMLHQMQQDGMVHQDLDDQLCVVHTFDELIEKLL
ncbi:MAG: TIGR00730 family Rossman fold protein [Bacteroidaceae bacterium]